MRFELAEIAHHKGYRRQVTEFRAIAPTKLLGEELARIYLANVMLWRAAVPRIIEQYRSSVASMRTDRAPALQSEIEHAQSTVESHKARNTAIVAAFLLRFEQWHRGQWIVIVKRTTVDLTHFIGAQDMAAVLETALARNAALISDISNEAAGKISDIVFRGLQNKTPVTQIASELQQVVGFARKRSIRVAHDQTIKLSSALDVARMAQAGADPA